MALWRIQVKSLRLIGARYPVRQRVSTQNNHHAILLVSTGTITGGPTPFFESDNINASVGGVVVGSNPPALTI